MGVQVPHSSNQAICYALETSEAKDILQKEALCEMSNIYIYIYIFISSLDSPSKSCSGDNACCLCAADGTPAGRNNVGAALLVSLCLGRLNSSQRVHSVTEPISITKIAKAIDMITR